MGLQGGVFLGRTLQEALDGRRETAKIRTVRCGCGSMVECDLPTVETRVRFPSPAPLLHPSVRTIYGHDRAVKTLIRTPASSEI